MTEYVIAFDFEAFGGHTPVNGFTQLGAALIDAKALKVLSTFSEYANQEGFTKEERCMREFWDQHPDTLAENEEKCNKSTNSPYEVVKMFWAWIDSVVTLDMDVVLVTDNAPFDAGILRAFSKTRDPLYAFGERRDIVDISVYYYGLNRVRINRENLDTSSKKQALDAIEEDDFPPFDFEHTHDASDDAKAMGLKFAWISQRVAHKF